eukprot:scaffold81629_cov56-Attheya_sp.AAC.2
MEGVAPVAAARYGSRCLQATVPRPLERRPNELKSILMDAMQYDTPKKRGLRSSWRALGVGKDQDVIGRKRTNMYTTTRL